MHGYHYSSLLFSDLERQLLNNVSLLLMKRMIVVRVASYKLVLTSFWNLDWSHLLKSK